MAVSGSSAGRTAWATTVTSVIGTVSSRTEGGMPASAAMASSTAFVSGVSTMRVTVFVDFPEVGGHFAIDVPPGHEQVLIGIRRKLPCQVHSRVGRDVHERLVTVRPSKQHDERKMLERAVPSRDPIEEPVVGPFQKLVFPVVFAYSGPDNTAVYLSRLGLHALASLSESESPRRRRHVADG